MKRISSRIARGLWRMADAFEWLGDKLYYPSVDDFPADELDLETKEQAAEFLRNI